MSICEEQNLLPFQIARQKNVLTFEGAIKIIFFLQKATFMKLSFFFAQINTKDMKIKVKLDFGDTPLTLKKDQIHEALSNLGILQYFKFNFIIVHRTNHAVHYSQT